jgi:hypothetical protein
MSVVFFVISGPANYYRAGLWFSFVGSIAGLFLAAWLRYGFGSACRRVAEFARNRPLVHDGAEADPM